jgi:flagellar motility protein MotE (MotC chaperone)
MNFIRSIWGTALLGVVCFLSCFVLLWIQIELPAPPPAEEHAEPAGATFTLQGNPEIDLLISDLQRRKEELDLRDKQLQEWAARLQSEAAELSQITQQVARLQSAFDEKVLNIQTEESANLKKLARTYSAMAPETAAAILNELDDASIVRVLVFMKEEETARVLEALSRTGETQAKRVADLSEKLRLAMFRTPDQKKKS